MKRTRHHLILGAAALALGLPAGAWELAGTKTLALHTREGTVVPIGSVSFVPEGDRYRFALKLDPARFNDYFLAMKEFKCLEGVGEIQCHVAYPYPNPGTVTAEDLAWLEHSLLFLFKAPKDFGARLWNGLYYQMKVTDTGIVGTPQAVDLNLISAPPDDPARPPYDLVERTAIVPETRWFSGLSIR